MEIKLTMSRFIKRLLLKIMKIFILLLCTTVFSLSPKHLVSQNTKIVIEKDAKTIQQKQISGKVSDKTGQPLPGATVFIKGTTKGVSTDFDGNYSITVADPDNVLVFSSLGFESQEITVGNQAIINITLIESTDKLSEVVVVGYGTSLKKDLTGSVGVIKAKEIVKSKSQTIEHALYGKVPGVFVQSAGGRPGAAASVIIRGFSQINGDNQPLYVIDDIPIAVNVNTSSNTGLFNDQRGAQVNAPFEFIGLGLGGAFFSTLSVRENPLLSINPADIESISILKDASATAIYGSRAANGVILITTKRGKRGQKPRFTFETSTSVQNPVELYPFLSTQQHREVYTDLVEEFNDNRAPVFMFDPITQTFIFALPPPTVLTFGDADTNWQKELSNENAIWTNHRLSLSGGSDNVNYAMSANVQDQEALIIGGDFKRNTFTASVDSNVSDKIKIGASINYNQSTGRNSSINSTRLFGNYRPDLPVFNDDGSFSVVVNADQGNAERPTPTNGRIFNPVGDEARIPTTSIRNSIFGSLYGEFKILKKLTLKSQISVGLAGGRVSTFVPSFTREALFGSFSIQGMEGSGSIRGFSDPPLAFLYNQRNDSQTITFQNTLSYNTTIADNHTINALVGLTWDSQKNDATSTRSVGFPNDFDFRNPASATFVVNSGSDFAQKALNSVFARINYNYKDKYLVTLTNRADASTQFGPDRRTGYFPSAGVAWNIHNESFLEDSKNINQLKLRASLGRTGNDNIPAFSFQPLFGSTGSYNGQAGVGPIGVPNSALQWETTDQLDFALEFGLFNNRLNAEFGWFNKKTNDLLLSVPATSQTGGVTRSENIASLTNKGWEFQIGGDIIRTDNFSWNSSFNISYIRSNVDDIRGDASVDGSPQPEVQGLTVGQPLGVIRGYDIIKIAGDSPADLAEIATLNAAAGGVYWPQAFSPLSPGDYIPRDVNGDNVITLDDRIIISSTANEPNSFGGWNNNLRYKNLELSFSFNFVQGTEKVILPSTELIAPGFGPGGPDFENLPNFLATDYFNTWTPENQNARFAKAFSPTLRFPTTRNVSDASYASLRTASIAYNFSGDLLKKVAISNARLTFTGNNLLRFDLYDGTDPESSEAGVNSGSASTNGRDTQFTYPQPITFVLGLSVTF